MGKGKAYGKKNPHTKQTYYGRGLVQLTWYDNYKKAGDALGLDLVNQPDLMLRLDISVAVLVRGMIEGWFAASSDRQRHTLSRHLDRDPPNYVEARRIINGTDKAATIAALAMTFADALKAAAAKNGSETPMPEPAPSKPAPALPPDVEPVEAPAARNTAGMRDIITLFAFVFIIGAVLWMLF
jgi:Chitinase class I